MVSEDLKWLIYPVVTNLLNPKEEVGKTTDVVPKVIVSLLFSLLQSYLTSILKLLKLNR